MNFKELADDMGLDEDTIKELVELFVNTSLNDLNALRSAIKVRNIKQAGEAIHSIKGAAENLGFDDIADIAQELENKTSKHSLEGADEVYTIIKEQIEVLAEHLAS